MDQPWISGVTGKTLDDDTLQYAFENLDLSDIKFTAMITYGIAAVLSTCTNKLIMSNINKNEDLRGPKYTLVYFSAVFHIILAVVGAWTKMLLIVTETPRSGFDSVAVHTALLLNGILISMTVMCHLELIVYQCFTTQFPHLEDVIIALFLTSLSTILRH